MIDRLLTRTFGKPNPLMVDWAESSTRRDSFPLEPRNAASNLAYPVAGLVLWAVYGGELALVFAAALTVLGVGSGLFHGWPTKGTRALDHAGMYAVFVAMLMGAAGAPVWAVASASGCAAVVGGSIHWPTEYAMALTLGGTVAILTIDGGLPPLGVISLAIFILAFGSWHLDTLRQWTGKWGHGAWHLGTGVAIALMLAAVLERAG